MPPRRKEAPSSSHGELTPLQLESYVPLTRVSEITSLSVATIRRRFASKIVRLSERRSGMKLKHALAIGTLGASP
jgi:hypothetical protein